MFTYLLLNLGTLAFPLALSFERKMAWRRQWRFVLPSLLVTALVFIVWDAWFTHLKVWGFNPRYLVGVQLLGLPLEEMMFFFTVPFACMFISGVVRHYLGARLHRLPRFSYLVSIGLVALCIALVATHWGHLYTMVAFGFAALWIILRQWFIPHGSMEEFYLSYLVTLIPFLVVNGVLTALPVVWYDDSHNLGLRIGTIPADDLAYSLGLFLMNHTLAAWLEDRRAVQLTLRKTA